MIVGEDKFECKNVDTDDKHADPALSNFHTKSSIQFQMFFNTVANLAGRLCGNPFLRF